MEWAKARFQLIMESSNAEIPFIGMGKSPIPIDNGIIQRRNTICWNGKWEMG